MYANFWENQRGSLCLLLYFFIQMRQLRLQKVLIQDMEVYFIILSLHPLIILKILMIESSIQPSNPNPQDKLAILSQISHQTLKLRLHKKRTQTISDIYQVLIKMDERSPLLLKYFDSLEEVQNYVRNVDNYTVDFQKMVFTVLQRFKRNKIIELAIFQVKLVEAASNYDEFKQIQTILQRVAKKQELYSSEIKISLHSISKTMKKMLIERQQQKQLNNKMAKEIQQLKNTNADLLNRFNLIEISIKSLSSDVSKPQVERKQVIQYEKQGEDKKLMEEKNEQIQLSSSEDNEKENKMQAQPIRQLQISETIYRLQDKLTFHAQQTQKRFQKHSRQIEKLSSLVTKNTHRPILLNKWIDSKNKDFKNLILSRNTVTVLEKSYIFGRNPLGRHDSFSFVICEIESDMQFGLADQKYVRAEAMGPNCIRFSGNGECFTCQAKGRRGEELSSNQCITVRIDFESGLIEVQSQGVWLHRIVYDRLREMAVTWVPFLCLESKDDKVAICY